MNISHRQYFRFRRRLDISRLRLDVRLCARANLHTAENREDLVQIAPNARDCFCYYNEQVTGIDQTC